MTPERQRELYEGAKTPSEVCDLLRLRGRGTEAKYIESIQAWIARQPAEALKNLRSMADGEEKLAFSRGIETAKALTNNDVLRARRLRTEQGEHQARCNALRWAATALTRGLASGALQAIAVEQQSTESPCSCGMEGNEGGGFHYPGAVGCLRADDSDEPSVFDAYRARRG